MSKFNQVKTGPEPVRNHQGGTGYKLKPEYELISLLSTGFENKYYEKENDREKRLIELIKTIGKKDPEFVAKALVYTRSVIGQRTVTHVGSVAVAQVLSGNPLGTKFFTKRHRKENKGGIVRRLDDMLEIIAYYYMCNPGKPLPNSIKRGFKIALESADTYELAKYQGKNKEVSLIDLVNLVHPKPSEKMQETFAKLMDGKLKQHNTAEDRNTKSGQEIAAKVNNGVITKEEAVIELNDAKAENWKDLIISGKLGYLALLRNLRNIVNVATDSVFNSALEMLVDEKRIKQSLVFPHQIDIAFEVLMHEGLTIPRRKNKLLIAINKAYELSIPNLTELFTHGKTAVVVDTSGSMRNRASLNGNRINSTCIEKASLIGATLAKGIECDIYQFASYCRSVDYNPIDSINTIKQTIIDKTGNVGYGTNFDEIFGTLKGKYDRVFIVSDMQGGDSIISRSSKCQTYKNKFGEPYIYAIDIQGYGSTMFKQNTKLIKIFGYSKDIYEYVKFAEIDPNKILKEIRKINI